MTSDPERFLTADQTAAFVAAMARLYPDVPPLPEGQRIYRADLEDDDD